MAGALQIGDILMLSQLAWKLGRAFTSGRRSAPAEFLEVETEMNGLARALKMLAETLFADSDSIISRADAETQSGVATILLACRQTLRDLESFVEQYQVITRHRTSSGFSVERSWSELVLSNFRKMMWTTEGGNIQALRNMLHMHTSTISLTMQALQSKSLAQLQNTVAPMAEKIDEIHGQVTGDLSDKIQEVHRIIVSIAGRSPALPAIEKTSYGTPAPLWPVTPEIEPIPEPLRIGNGPLTPQRSPEIRPIDWAQAQRRRESDISTAPSASDTSDTRRSSSCYPASRSSITGSPGPSGRRQSRRHVESNADLPAVCDADEAEEQSPSAVDELRASFSLPILPPPAIPPDPDPELVNEFGSPLVCSSPTPSADKIVLERSATTRSQTEEFERAAFRNSAILCDVRGKAVDYVAPPEDETRPLDVETYKAMEACRICIVRKRDERPDGSIRMITSIWALSDDRAVRLQQKLADGVEIIPYVSFFSPEKISLPVLTELKFHDVTHGSKPLKAAKTSWITYYFEDVKSATFFQNELMGRQLIGTYQTNKTLRIHDGLAGILTYQEQMCGMEHLRLWHDYETGGVIAMIHFSAHFRNGYLAFYLNSSAVPVRVKGDGEKAVRIRDLKIPHTPEGRRSSGQRRRDSDGAVTASVASQDEEKVSGKKWITGAKVEFATATEKKLFLDKVKEVQQTMILLPEL